MEIHVKNKVANYHELNMNYSRIYNNYLCSSTYIIIFGALGVFAYLCPHSI